MFQKIGDLTKSVGATFEFTCPKHGPYTAWMLIDRYGRPFGKDPGCPRCREEYYEEHREEIEAEAARREEARRLEVEAEEARRRQKRFEEALDGSCIPSDYRDVSFENYKPTTDKNAEALRQCRLYAQNFRRAARDGIGLFLYGPTGTGKTHLACSILRTLLPEVDGGYAEMWRIIKTYKQAGFKEDALAPFIETHLLIVDEVGLQYGSRFEENVLYPLVDSRYAERRPTIFISNLQPDSRDESQRPGTVRGLVGERIWDRIQSRSVFLRMTGDSYRKRPRSVDDLLGGFE